MKKLIYFFLLLLINNNYSQTIPSVNGWIFVGVFGYPNYTKMKSFWGEEGQIFQFYSGTMVMDNNYFFTQTDWVKDLNQVYEMPDTVSLTFKIRDIKNANANAIDAGLITYALQMVPGMYCRERYKKFDLVLNQEQEIKFYTYVPHRFGMTEFNRIYLVWNIYSQDSCENGATFEMLSFKGIFNDGTVVEYESFSPPSLVEEFNSNPNRFELHQNYPNPFNPSTSISFTLAERSNVTLKVMDVLGREVATLLSGEKEAGKHNVIFDASNLSTGMYIYTLQAGSFSISNKMLLMK